MNAREIAHRILAAELNGSTLEKKEEGEQTPAYTVTPLGAAVNRVFIAGTLTDNNRTGTEEDPVWRATVEDPTGRFYLQAGRFQPGPAAVLANLDAEDRPILGVVGKVNTWTSQDGKTYVNIRPEAISVIGKDEENAWLLDAVSGLWKRLLDVKTAMKYPESTVEELAGMGLGENAKNVCDALDHYDNPDSARYLRAVQSVLRKLLPEEDIDFGLPEDARDMQARDEPKEEQAALDDSPSAGDAKDVILDLVKALDDLSRGASTELITAEAGKKGIPEATVESLLDELMNEGQVYEPFLGYIRLI